MWFLSNAVAKFASQVSANVTTAQIFPLRVDAGGGSYSASATLPAQLPVPGSGRFEQRAFDIYASGYAIVRTTATVLVGLYASNPLKGDASLTPGSNTILHASSASSSITATKRVPWSFHYHIEGFSSESLSPSIADLGAAQGWAEGQIDGVYQAAAAFSAGSGEPITAATNLFGPAAASSTPPPNTEPAFNLVIGVTFSANGAGALANIANLSAFSLVG